MRRRRVHLPGSVWVAGFAFLALLLWWTHQTAHPSGQEGVHGVDVQAHLVDTSLSVTYAHQQWHGQSLYVLRNLSSASLKTVQVFSWSNQPLPMLWIGQSLPNNFAQSPPTVHPPVSLAPGQAVWFELSEQPPQTLTVLWLENGHSVYENVSVH